jgi:hypothetical protein
MEKNRVVYLDDTYFVVDFEETRKAWKDTSITDLEYEKMVTEYYNSNFGLMVIDWMESDARFKITNESKFALFMLQYPHHIEKIVYE